MGQTFRNLIAANKRNSVLLVLAFCLFVAAVAMVLVLVATAYLAPDLTAGLDWRRALLVGGAAAGVALLVALAAYYGGDRMVLGFSGAAPLRHEDDPELFNVVEEMAIAA